MEKEYKEISKLTKAISAYGNVFVDVQYVDVWINQATGELLYATGNQSTYFAFECDDVLAICRIYEHMTAEEVKSYVEEEYEKKKIWLHNLEGEIKK